MHKEKKTTTITMNGKTQTMSQRKLSGEVKRKKSREETKPKVSQDAFG